MKVIKCDDGLYVVAANLAKYGNATIPRGGERVAVTWLLPVGANEGDAVSVDGHHADRIARWLVDPDGPAILDLTTKEEAAPGDTGGIKSLSDRGYCVVSVGPATGWHAMRGAVVVGTGFDSNAAAWDACRAHYAASKATP